MYACAIGNSFEITLCHYMYNSIEGSTTCSKLCKS